MFGDVITLSQESRWGIFRASAPENEPKATMRWQAMVNSVVFNWSLICLGIFATVAPFGPCA